MSLSSKSTKSIAEKISRDLSNKNVAATTQRIQEIQGHDEIELFNRLKNARNPGSIANLNVNGEEFEFYIKLLTANEKADVRTEACKLFNEKFKGVDIDDEFGAREQINSFMMYGILARSICHPKPAKDQNGRDSYRRIFLTVNDLMDSIDDSTAISLWSEYIIIDSAFGGETMDESIVDDFMVALAGGAAESFLARQTSQNLKRLAVMIGERLYTITSTPLEPETV